MVPPLHEEYTDGDFISPMELRTSISSSIFLILSLLDGSAESKFIISSFEYDLDGLSLRKFSSLVLYKG
jgi:hypothetical protein